VLCLPVRKREGKAPKASRPEHQVILISCVFS